MATPEEENKQQEEKLKLLELENKILKEKLKLQSESFDLSSGLVDSLKETLGIRFKQTTFEGTLLNINKDINKTIFGQKGNLSDIGAIQKQIIKNEEILGKAKLSQISLEKSIGEEGKKKTKIVFDLFKAQQELQNEIQVELDKAEKGLEINQSLIESTQRQILLNDKSIQQEVSKLSSLEQQYAFNQLNAGELDKQNKEREKEKIYLDNLNKSMGLTGALASGLETTLKKLGFSKLSEQLGINDALEKTKGFAKEITVGSNGIATMGQKFQIATKLITTMGSNLLKSLGPLALLGELLTSLVKADKATGELAKSFNITYKEANNVRQELNSIANSSGDIAINTRGLQESMIAVGNALGTNVMLNKEDLTTMTQLAEKAGISREEQMGMLKLSLATGKSLESNVGEFMAQAKIQAQNNGIIVNEKQLLKEVNNTSNAIKLSIGGTGGELGKAVAVAKALGMNLEQVDRIAGSLLQFESSISAELEAELLTGKQLNLEKARYYALTNNAVGLAQELSKNIGTAAEFGKMNRIQQEAYAKSLGMSREEIAASLVESEALKNMTKDQAAAASSAFKARVADVGLEKAQKELAEGKLQDMMNQQSMQERFNQSVEKLKEIFVTVADAMMPILDILTNVFELVNLIITPVQMWMNFMGRIGEYISNLIGPLGVIGKILKVAAGLSIIFAAYKAVTSLAAIPIIGAPLGIAAAAAITTTGFGLLSKIGDLNSPSTGKTVVSTKEGGLFELSPNDDLVAAPGISAALSQPKKETSNTNISLDINPLLEAINRLEAAINSRPIMVETKIELDGQQISYNQSTGTNSFRS
jgi:hypothetical protein